MATIEQARQAKTRIQNLLNDVPQINGIGITRSDGGWGVQVNVRPGFDAASLNIPASVDGVPVIARDIGRAIAHSQ
jgi:hypothetical protein